MITSELEAWLNKNLGAFEYPQESDTYSFRLQDFDDMQIESVLSGITNRFDLFDRLRTGIQNQDIIAHLYGDTSAEARRNAINEFKNAQERMQK